MIIKVPIYVDINSKGLDQDLLPDVVFFLSDRLTENLKAKLPKSRKQITEKNTESGEEIVHPFEVVTREEALDSFR